jgi:hypothetical protein
MIATNMLMIAVFAPESFPVGSRTEVGYYREITGGLDWGPGDLCWVPHSVAIPGLAEWVAPTVAERLVAQGHVPEIWGSANRG